MSIQEMFSVWERPEFSVVGEGGGQNQPYAFTSSGEIAMEGTEVLYIL